MGVLKKISRDLFEIRQRTGRRESFNDYKNIIKRYASVGGMRQIYDDLQPMPSMSYIPSGGQLVFFRYSPKLRNELSIYDVYPLVYAFGATTTVEIGTSAFFGANIHYINKSKTGGIRDRISAKNKIIKTFSEEELFREDYLLLMSNLTSLIFSNQKNKLIGYNGASLYHKYIQRYIRSQIYIVPPEYVDIMMFMDLEQFVKR